MEAAILPVAIVEVAAAYPSTGPLYNTNSPDLHRRHMGLHLELKAMKYFCINYEDQRGFVNYKSP